MDVLLDIEILLASAVGALFLCGLLRVPVLLGFLGVGLVAGPHGFGWVGGPHRVEMLAEVGVSLLLFSVGMEFSQESLSRIQRAMFKGGPLQVGGTLGLCLLIALLAGWDFSLALLAGMLAALSSTAIVIRSLQERAELDSPHGQNALGILIFQDLLIIPMMLVLPLMGTGETGGLGGLEVLRGMGLMFLVTLAGWKVLPWVLFLAARSRNKEMFLLTLLAVCFFMAWFAHSQGLSPAIGALLAGIVISRSEFSHEALGNVTPFRDVFMSFFFVSLGMLMDPKVLVQEPLWIALGAVFLVVLKALVVMGTGIVMGLPLRTLILMGAALAQIGELSFVLAQSAVNRGILPGEIYQGFLAAAVLTMGSTPVLIKIGHILASLALRWKGWPCFLLAEPVPKDASKEELSGHLVILGFGLNGRNLARAAKAGGIRYVIVEANLQTVRKERSKGEPILYGDGSHESVLRAAGIELARALVVVINDPGAVRTIVSLARRISPGLYIIARTRYLQEVEPLYRLGADEVIPEEFETSVEIFTRVLRRFLVPEDQVEKMVEEIRAEGYEMLRSSTAAGLTVCDIGALSSGIEVRSLRIQEGSQAVGRSLAQLDFRKRYGVTVVAIRRGEELIVDPDPRSPLLAGDVLVVLADPQNFPGVTRILEAQEKA